MKHEPLVVSTENAPQAIGPYSQAIACGGFLFLSGQIPLDPATGELVTTSFAAQVERVLANIDGVLAAGGCTRASVAKVNVFLTDLQRFAEFNEIYGRFFGGHRPARAVVQVSALPRNAQIEIEAIAVRE
jgi:2-iminobutanoate/2-iminopropanoate deaminase